MGKKLNSIGLWDMRLMFHCSLIMFFLGVFATLSFYKITTIAERRIINKGIISTYNYTYKNTNTRPFDHPRRVKVPSPSPPPPPLPPPLQPPPPPPSSLTEGCDLFSGRWVYDNKSHYPLYKDYECPFMHGDLACQTWGRKDLKYQQWRWQPHGCDFPRFDGKAVLERLRDKRVMFVGDSVNRNQWVSMVCMLQAYIPDGFKEVSLRGQNGSLYTFKATEYNASIDYYWAPLLVESNGDNPSNHRISDRAIRSKAIEKHAKHWVNKDILIFNSYLWWKIDKLKILQSGSFDGPDQVYEKVDSRRCYEMVLGTWSKWLSNHVDPFKTKLFFMSMTATHARGEEWGMKGKSCYGQTEPVTKEGFQESGSDPKMMKILESSLTKLKAKGVNVQLINITQLTQYRKDGHPSIYKKQWRPLTEKQQQDPSSYSDCAHWCLPGVPDVWNELLSIYILR